MVSDDFPIDFVIPWVDGNDPAWLAEKNKYSSRKSDDSNSANRYRDWGLLPYWFRAVEKYTPWVNRIHFITWGHIPAFLNTEHPKLHIVQHEDYIPKDYLPTFSANPIEMNMHRIPGLSKHFVYFNDDMFILRPMERTSFFQNGLPCVYGAEYPITPSSGEVWQYLLLNDISVINRHFSKIEQNPLKALITPYMIRDKIRGLATGLLFPKAYLGFKLIHAPAAFLKETFETIWAAEPELLDATSRNRFRAVTDVNQWLALWWQVASGKYVPYRTDNVTTNANQESMEKIEDTIIQQSHDMLCINDPAGNCDFEHSSQRLRQAFESILPEKSDFEK